MLNKRPLIGMTLDSQEPGGYSKMPWYALRKNYCEAVSDAGGSPLPLPHDQNAIETYARILDGLIITGGNFDIPPHYYGEDSVHTKVTTKDERTQFEWNLTKRIYELEKPIIGICGGMQLLNVLFGGTLIQHIPDEVEDALAHEQPTPRTGPGHSVDITPHTKLHTLLQQDSLEVNSAHHQAVKKVAPNWVACAHAPDGVIEAIEDTKRAFCIGVQWHPEYYITSYDKVLFTKFIQSTEC